MPRLRMKPSTLSATEEAVLRATRRASRKSKHKTRRHESESLSPPRHPTSTSTSVPDCDFDESSVPPSEAYKRTRSQEEDDERAEQEEFAAKLTDAAHADLGIGFHEYHHLAYSTPYGSAAGTAAGVALPPSTSRMDEDEYAEYIRAGMWRRQNKERLEAIERHERMQRERAERERLEQLERDRKERLRIEKLERRKTQLAKLERDNARERYEVGWKKLHAMIGGGGGGAEGDPGRTSGLRFTDFVWPVFPPFALPPISWPSANEITPNAIEEFLLPDEVQGEARRAKVRTAVLSYHPDRFERFVARVGQDDNDNEDEDDGVRDRVRALGLRVSQVLNDLLKELASSKK